MQPPPEFNHLEHFSIYKLISEPYWGCVRVAADHQIDKLARLRRAPKKNGCLGITRWSVDPCVA